jgi:hypothetical protein
MTAWGYLDRLLGEKGDFRRNETSNVVGYIID